MTPENAPESAVRGVPQQELAPPELSPGRPSSWRSRLLSICFAIFTFEIGLFLVVFPWMDTWDLNYFQGAIPGLRRIWDDPYFRGAVTGLGMVNIYLAFLEIARLLRRPR